MESSHHIHSIPYSPWLLMAVQDLDVGEMNKVHRAHPESEHFPENRKLLSIYSVSEQIILCYV